MVTGWASDQTAHRGTAHSKTSPRLKASPTAIGTGTKGNGASGPQPTMDDMSARASDGVEVGKNWPMKMNDNRVRDWDRNGNGDWDRNGDWDWDRERVRHESRSQRTPMSVPQMMKFQLAPCHSPIRLKVRR